MLFRSDQFLECGIDLHKHMLLHVSDKQVDDLIKYVPQGWFHCDFMAGRPDLLFTLTIIKSHALHLLEQIGTNGNFPIQALGSKVGRL